MNPRPPEMPDHVPQELLDEAPPWMVAYVSVIEHRQERQRWALKTMAYGLVCAIVFLGAIGLVALHNTGRIDRSQRTAVVTERVDAHALRAAAWRGCERDMLERANQYVANRAVLEVPAFVRLFPPELVEQSVRRQRRLLPILDCDPNLCGRAPTIMSAQAQKGFIAAYEHGLLAPNPAPPSRHGRC